MIRKYSFGHPIETGAVVQDLHCEKDKPRTGKIRIDEKGFTYIRPLEKETAIYGLGETVRGINKRGWQYVSENEDQSFHMEDVRSLYSAHNFILLSDSEPLGLFFDYSGRISFDTGYTRADRLIVSCEHADLCLYEITGESLREICRTFRKMTGRSYIAPKWALGYGQSRWGYEREEDFRKVVDGYRKNHIPLDAVYMDIDYMKAYKDFTIDQEKFPDFKRFVSEMKEKKIHLVPIIDAGIKQEEGYDVCEEGLEMRYFCTDREGRPFDTACWPGLTYHPDFLNAKTREWFGNKYRILTDLGIDGFWNDMNEPSVFYTKRTMEEVRKKMRKFLSKPAKETAFFELAGLTEEFSSPEIYKDFYHDMDGTRICHDRVHNLYGYMMTRAAGEAFEKISPDKRILIFSRSSYIGMHRYGGIWQGDNKSWWSHLLLNIQMTASLNMCGFLYTGADLGGFGSDTGRDLLLRWLAFGVFTPLMRNHSAFNTRNQECYNFENPEDFAHVIGVRYRLLPYLYSEYVKAALKDDMYFRPLAFDYPMDRMACGIEDQLMLGEGLMVTPIYTQNADGRYVYLPEEMLFVKFIPSGEIETKRMEKGIHYIHVELNEVPLFIRKNHFLPLAAAAECVDDLDEEDLTLLGWITEKSEYLLYHDDGYTRDYETPDHYRILTMDTEDAGGI